MQEGVVEHGTSSKLSPMAYSRAIELSSCYGATYIKSEFERAAMKLNFINDSCAQLQACSRNALSRRSHHSEASLKTSLMQNRKHFSGSQDEDVNQVITEP